MIAPTRRFALGSMIGLGSAVIACGLSKTARAQASRPIPERPLKLTRSIEYVFFDGSFLNVSRGWRTMFQRSGQGINVVGEQVEIAVDASPSRSPAAEYERARSTVGLWPIRLSASGMILAMGSTVSSEVATGELPASFAALEQLPDDLFFPTLGPLSSEQAIELPNGMLGKFSIQYDATSVPEGGWLDRAQRHVVTQIGTTRESVLERWMMADL